MANRGESDEQPYGPASFGGKTKNRMGWLPALRRIYRSINHTILPGYGQGLGLSFFTSGLFDRHSELRSFLLHHS